MSCSWRSAGGKLGLSKTPTSGTPGTRSRNRPSRFGSIKVVIKVMPRGVAAGPVPAFDQPGPDRVAARPEHDRDRRSGAFGCDCRRLAAGRRQHVHAAAHQVGGQRWQKAVLTACPSELDRDVLALDKTAFGEPLAEGGDEVR